MGKKVHKHIGQVPGAAIYIGNKSDSDLLIEVFDYSNENITENVIENVEELKAYLLSNTVSWINVNGLSQPKAIESLGQMSSLHPLIIEDIVNTQQRPKVEEYEKYLFVVLKMLYFEEDGNLKSEHLSLILTNNTVISFQEADGDVFEPIRDRLRHAKGRIRSMGTDYLFYALMDAVVDNYFVLLEALGDKVTILEDRLFGSQQDQNFIEEIQSLKKEILKIRKAVLPVRELVNKLEKGDTSVISPKTKIYLRDLYDHTAQVSESVEIYREMIWGLMDMYMTTISNKMNEVMKVLTIMATIFIPLTFLVGVYGMNFKNMPELELEYGYPIFWGIILIVFLVLIFYFKRKKWL